MEAFNIYILSTEQFCSFGSYISVRNRSALSAHDGPDLAALWSGVEVFDRGLGREPLHVALDTNLHNKNEKD